MMIRIIPISKSHQEQSRSPPGQTNPDQKRGTAGRSPDATSPAVPRALFGRQVTTRDRNRGLHNGSLPASVNDGIPAFRRGCRSAVLANRQPVLLSRLFGWFLLRLATRTLFGVLLKAPPRTERAFGFRPNERYILQSPRAPAFGICLPQMPQTGTNPLSQFRHSQTTCANPFSITTQSLSKSSETMFRDPDFFWPDAISEEWQAILRPADGTLPGM